MKALQVIQYAYRCTVEEQDDPVVWFAQVLEKNGGDVDVLLRGNAVNYGVVGQNPPSLSFGDWEQSHPSRLGNDIEATIGQGIKVYAIAEDLRDRGIAPAKLIKGVETITRVELPDLFEQYDQVWSW